MLLVALDNSHRLKAMLLICYILLFSSAPPPLLMDDLTEKIELPNAAKVEVAITPPTDSGPVQNGNVAHNTEAEVNIFLLSILSRSRLQKGLYSEQGIVLFASALN